MYVNVTFFFLSLWPCGEVVSSCLFPMTAGRLQQNTNSELKKEGIENGWMDVHNPVIFFRFENQHKESLFGM